MKKSIAAALLFVLAFGLCACQKAPERSIVTSKNDGAFEAALKETSEPTAAPEGADMTEPTPEPVLYEDSFTGAAGGIAFTLSLTEPNITSALPVLRARPMEITSEMAQRIARAIFGDAEMYEYSEQPTRAEIEESILGLSRHISDWGALVDYYDGDEKLAASVKEDFESRIAKLEALYETASDTVQPEPCAWEFHPWSYYLDPAFGDFPDEGHRLIQATATLDGTPYVFSVCNREAEDYIIHNATVYIDDRLVSSENVYTDTDETPDMDALRERALSMVEAMDIGQWALAPDGTVDMLGFNSNGSMSAVVLTRVYNGMQASYHTGGDGGSEDEYAARYADERILFRFNGERLIEFSYEGALQVTETANENVQILPFEEILEQAKVQMQMMNPERFLYYSPESVLTVEAEQVELGLSRIRVKNSSADYYLTPTYTFYGAAKQYDASGEPVMLQWYNSEGDIVKETEASQFMELAVINAVDGSAVNTQLGY